MDVSKIDARTAAAMVARMGTVLADELRAIARDTASPVHAEIDAIRALREVDPRLHAQTCVVFAIISPRTKFEKNVRATRRMMHAIDRDFSTVDDVYQCLTDGGKDSWFSAGGVSRSLFASLAWIRTLDIDDMNKPALLALNRAGTVKGLGRKTASMAVALFDASAPVITLDVHMLRGLLKCANMNAVGDLSINDSAYDVLEASVLNSIDDLLNGAHIDYFYFQWALWNRWGFGTHVTHLPIFIDDTNAEPSLY